MMKKLIISALCSVCIITLSSCVEAPKTVIITPESSAKPITFSLVPTAEHEKAILSQYQNYDSKNIDYDASIVKSLKVGSKATLLSTSGEEREFVVKEATTLESEVTGNATIFLMETGEQLYIDELGHSSIKYRINNEDYFLEALAGGAGVIVKMHPDLEPLPDVQPNF